jgi:hypothetical protein
MYVRSIELIKFCVKKDSQNLGNEVVFIESGNLTVLRGRHH